MMTPDPEFRRLGGMRPGEKGIIRRLDVGAIPCPFLDPAELERRLLEMGFVEGATIRILHEGLIGGDPVVFEVNGARLALRRNEANAILVGEG